MPQAPGAGGGKVTLPYRNPLRDANVTPARVDQGVDYTGSGPIYALGPGVIVSTKNAGWPGGGFIVERLTAGPAAGHYVYVAEQVQPTVRVGQHVDTDTRIGYFAPPNASGGIETGWAAPPPSLGEPLAWISGQSNYHGDPGEHPTAFGEAYNKLLTYLGATPGILNGSPVGTVPGWAMMSGLLKGVKASGNGQTGTAAGKGCTWPKGGG